MRFRIYCRTIIFCFGLLSTLVFESHTFASQPDFSKDIHIYYYTATNCPHCRILRPHITKLIEQYGQEVRLIEKDIWQDREAFEQLIELLKTYGDYPVSTPTVFLADRLWVGMQPKQIPELKNAIDACLNQACQDSLLRLQAFDLTDRNVKETSKQTVTASEDTHLELPLLGVVNARDVSLPLVTLVLGLLDSFNPCAFFVLLFLISLLVHAHSRPRMLLVGLVFVFFSGLIYFLFMAAWLNLFLTVKGLHFVTIVAGIIAVLIGLLNVKDFFLFHQGLTLAIPEKAKSRLFQRTRQLVQVGSYPLLLGGTILLAIAANTYELLCTAGFPMVYTRILTLKVLPEWVYYGYLGAYNLVYVTPLLLIVVISVITFGRHKLTEQEGQLLKLVSGVMMTELGLVLIFWPNLLNDLVGTILLFVSTLLVVVIVMILGYWRKRHQHTE